jgi:cation:H+ antiporter
MLLYLSSLLTGLILLVWGADRMVVGAAVIARNLGVTPMVIGLTVVGFATSAPEILVSATAAIRDVSNLALGNAFGSNIANIGLVVGVAAILHPLTVESEALSRELPAMVAVSLIPVILLIDLTLSRLDGVILLIAFFCFIYWVIKLGKRSSGHDAIEAEYVTEIPEAVTQRMAILWIIIGLVVLVVGSNALVWGSQNIAREVGVSDLVIGVTVVAIGTSLPELAVAVIAVRKGLHGLALGNIIGSNAFNMLAVIGVAGVIRPATLDLAAVQLHLPVLLGFTVAFFFIAYNSKGTMRVGRLEGAALVASFIIYQSYIAQQNL